MKINIKIEWTTEKQIIKGRRNKRKGKEEKMNMYISRQQIIASYL